MKKKELAKNTLILLIGKFCTQFISFFLLPLYTNLIPTNEYGTIDLMMTYVSLIVPIITLQMENAVFRFLIDTRSDNDGKTTIISNSIFLSLFSIIFFLIVYIPIFILYDFQYKMLFLLYLVITIFSNIFLQICRGLGDNKSYTLGSIIAGGGNVILNVIFLVLLNYGSNSLFLSIFLSNLVCCIFIFFRLKIYKYVNMKKISILKLKEMLKYSIPLIPNGVIWWIIGVSDKTVISIFLGTGMNGIYAISQKFSNLVMNIYGVFNMSWSESLSLHINEEDSANYISDIFNNILSFFIIVCSLLLLFLQLFYNIVIGDAYLQSYTYIPLLLIGSIFNMIASFLGGIYIAKKKTNEIAKTSFYAGIINIVVNVLLIKIMGLYAACLSTIISFIVISMYRYHDCKKYVNINIDIWKNISFILIFIIAISLYYLKNNILTIVMIFIIIIITLKKYLNIILKLKDKIMTKTKKENGR